MPTAEKLNIPINIRLDQDFYDKLQERTGVSADGLNSMLSNAANQLVDTYYSGGIVLRVDDVRRIEKVLGKPVSSAEEVVRAVQKGAGREDGQYTVKFQLDPAYEQPLKDHAEMLGWPVVDVVKEVVETVLTNGWCHSFQPTGGHLDLTDEQAAKIRRLTGKQSFGADDVIEAMSRRAPRAEVIKMEPRGEVVA